MLDRAADLAEAEGAQRSAVALALADLATNLRDPDLGHLLVLLPAAAAEQTASALLSVFSVLNPQAISWMSGSGSSV